MGKSILLKWCDGCIAVCFTMFLIWDIASVSFMSFIQNSFLMLINTVWSVLVYSCAVFCYRMI